MNLKCCIVDDEPLALDLLESYVQKTPFLTLCGKFTDAISALDFINRDDIDLAFLDIQMPDINGMELSKMIRNRCRIIFTTAFSQYAVDSYKIPAIDYLLKPISYADFLEACNRAVEWFELKNKHVQTENGNTGIESIFVKSDYKLRQIELKKILYIEGLKDYIKIYLEDEPHPVLSLMSLKSMEEMLPSSRFMRVHRSFIVQPDKIKIIERNRIVFGKQYIPISDSDKNEFAEFLNRRSVKTHGNPSQE